MPRKQSGVNGLTPVLRYTVATLRKRVNKEKHSAHSQSDIVVVVYDENLALSTTQAIKTRFNFNNEPKDIAS